MEDTPRQMYLKRHAALKTQRSSWDQLWRELSENIQPRRSRFFTSDTNRGEKKHGSIINGTPTFAARVLAAGMMAGCTSPARPWFRLTTPDPELAEYGSVRQWLHLVQERILQAFARSNVYKALANVYLDLGTFGTSAMFVEEDTEEVLRAYVYPLGSYCLAASERGSVDTMFRDVRLTVRQTVKKFSLVRCSRTVRDAYQRGQYDDAVDIVHLLQPNGEYQEGRMGPRGKPWKSCWFEAGGQVGANASDREADFLKESGYLEMPLMAPRWFTTGEDVYGSSPGMDALGDARALQVLEEEKGKAVAKLVSPPMRGPASLLQKQASLLPGAYNAVDAAAPGQTFEPAMEINPSAITVVAAEIAEHSGRIKTAFYADLWLMLAATEPGQMTAREVAERHEEKMLQLGPVMEQLEDECYEPLIDRAFSVLLRRGDIPPPPPELQGQELKVDYQSIMAEAQKMLASTGIERLTTFAANLGAVRPEVFDKVNWDEVVDEMGAALGVKPDLLNSDDKVAEIRAARAKQEQEAAAMAKAQQVAETTKTLASAPTEDRNALTDMMGPAAGALATAGSA